MMNLGLPQRSISGPFKELNHKLKTAIMKAINAIIVVIHSGVGQLISSQIGFMGSSKSQES